MADRRRRRKRASQDSEEEDESGSGAESTGSGLAGEKVRGTVAEPVEPSGVRPEREPEAEPESECESEDGIGEAVLSDYDSADPEDNGSHSEAEEEEEVEVKQFSDGASTQHADAKSHEDHPAEELLEQVMPEEEAEEEEEEEEEAEGAGQGKEVKVEEKGNLAGERQSGDGQESTDDPENKTGGKTGKKLDDDEDRKNPAYIPRKGLFFEHDVRGQAHEEDIRPKGRHRKLWKDEGRWEHDRFREEEQAPKSRDELIAMYGYDIRNNNGPADGRIFRSRKPRYNSSSTQDKRVRNGQKPGRTSWANGGSNTNPASSSPPVSIPAPSSSAPPPPRVYTSSGARGSRSFQGGRIAQVPYRGEGRVSYKPSEESQRGRALEVERSPAVLVEEEQYEEEEEDEEVSQQQQQLTYYNSKSSKTASTSPRRREELPQEPAPPRDVSPATPTAPERTVERKSYSLARRTRTKPMEVGKQASVEDTVPVAQPLTQAASTSVKNDCWEVSGDGPAVQTELSGLDQDLARLGIAGQSWTQSPPSYLRAEMRGIPNSMHMAGGPPQYNRMDEMVAGAGRAKRYSSQRQRPVPEPMCIAAGIMEGHYYDPMSFQGPIYTHSESPTPLPPQGMLVQPEMHLPHPGLHPHQSAAPMPNAAMYAGPAVTMSPGQPPQQLLPPPFYPPPGVMAFGNTNFPYPAGATLPPMYGNPQAQAQVYGGVTYYDTMQQQAQPKPSPPRRSSQPVSIKPPPPEEERNAKAKDKAAC